MAVQCANCGRSDLMQALIRGHQCLACGEVIDENQNQVVPQDKGPNLSNAGIPVKELGEPAPVILATVVPEAPVEAPEPVEEEVIEEEPLDLASLTPEQLAQIQEIVSSHG
jgi:hypothetical protein